MPPLAIVVPCFNEADRLLGKRFADFCEANPNVAILFVDDGSSDATWHVLESLCEGKANMSCFRLPHNVGKAEAVRRGILELAQTSKDSTHVAFLDADLATPLEEVLRMYEEYRSSSYSLIIGSRIQRAGSDVQRNIWRHYIGRVFSTAAVLMTEVNVYDSQCGAKIFTSTSLAQLFNEPFISRWFFDLEILIRAQAHDLKVIEVPLNQWHEIGGSKIKVRDFVATPLELLRIRRHYL